MGLRQQLQYRHPTKVPIQNAQMYDRCAIVCIKLHAYNDLGIPYIKDVIQERSSKHHDRIEVHLNPLLQPLLEKK
jgi:hypothetical protein